MTPNGILTSETLKRSGAHATTGYESRVEADEHELDSDALLGVSSHASSRTSNKMYSSEGSTGGGGLSTGVKIGLALGAIAILAVLALILVYFLHWKPEADKLEAEKKKEKETAEQKAKFERERLVVTFVQFDHGDAMQARNEFATSTKSILCNENKCIEQVGSEWKDKAGVVTVVKGVGGARFRSDRAKENGVFNKTKLPFVDMAMIHLAPDFSFKVSLPSGPGVYDVIVKTGDLDHPFNCAPRFGIQVGTTVVPVISDDHSEAVDLRRSGEVTTRVDLKTATECVFVGTTSSTPSFKIFRILKSGTGPEADRMFLRSEIGATMDSVRSVFPGASVLPSVLIGRIAAAASYDARLSGWMLANNSGFMNDGKEPTDVNEFVCRMFPGPEGTDTCASADASAKRAIIALIRAKPTLIDAARLPAALAATVHSFAPAFVDTMPNRIKQIQLVRVQ